MNINSINNYRYKYCKSYIQEYPKNENGFKRITEEELEEGLKKGSYLLSYDTDTQQQKLPYLYMSDKFVTPKKNLFYKIFKRTLNTHNFKLK